VRSVTRRSVPAIVGGLVAALVAAIAALAINLGILGAIGPPEGPGRLDAATAPRAVSLPSPGQRPIRLAPPSRGRSVVASGEGEAKGHHRYGAGSDD
jgi:hypothetical protein